MLNKIEFSDLYRFLTSIGLIFIASAFLIPWLFMKQELGMISETDYNSLIESSKSLADNRIKLNLFVIKSIPFISIGLFLFGGFLIFIGFKNWKKKQNDIDESDVIRLAVLRATSELNSQEIDEKAESEIREETEAIETEKQPSNLTKPENSKPNLEELKSNLIGMEKLFYDKIVSYNSFIYEPKSNVKIDDKFEIDIVLNPINKSKYSDVFIEVKYLQRKLSMDIVKKSFGQLVRINSHVYNKTKKQAKLILILVYHSNIADNNQIHRFKSGVNEYVKQFNVGQFQHFILSEKEAENFQVTNIIR